MWFEVDLEGGENGGSEFEGVSSEFKEFRNQMKDPLVVGAMLHKISEERSSANMVLKEINAKLDRLLSLEARLASLERVFSQSQKIEGKKQVVLSETDEGIMKLVKKQGKACAEDVQKMLKYKGVNAACSRLSRLHQLGLLEKMQAGKKVFYLQKTHAAE